MKKFGLQPEDSEGCLLIIALNITRKSNTKRKDSIPPALIKERKQGAAIINGGFLKISLFTLFYP